MNYERVHRVGFLFGQLRSVLNHGSILTRILQTFYKTYLEFSHHSSLYYIHPEALCRHVLDRNHVVNTVMKIVNF